MVFMRQQIKFRQTTKASALSGYGQRTLAFYFYTVDLMPEIDSAKRV